MLKYTRDQVRFTNADGFRVVVWDAQKLCWDILENGELWHYPMQRLSDALARVQDFSNMGEFMILGEQNIDIKKVRFDALDDEGHYVIWNADKSRWAMRSGSYSWDDGYHERLFEVITMMEDYAGFAKQFVIA